MYEKGTGVEPDHVRALMWYSLAVESAHGDKGNLPTGNRDRVGARRTPAEMSLAKKMARDCAASKFEECR
jgi:hypothetical protein